MPDLSKIQQRADLLQRQRYEESVRRAEESKQAIARIGERDANTGQYQVIHMDGSISTNGQKIFNTSEYPGQFVRSTQAFNQQTAALDGPNYKRRPVEEPVKKKKKAMVEFYFQQGDGNEAEYFIKAVHDPTTDKVTLSIAFLVDYLTADPLNNYGFFWRMTEYGFTMLDASTLFLYDPIRKRLYTLNLTTRTLTETPYSISRPSSPNPIDTVYSIAKSANNTVLLTGTRDTGGQQQSVYQRTSAPLETQKYVSFAPNSPGRYWSIASVDGSTFYSQADYLGLTKFDFGAGSYSLPTGISYPAIQTSYPKILETTYLMTDRVTGKIYVHCIVRPSVPGYADSVSKTLTVTGTHNYASGTPGGWSNGTGQVYEVSMGSTADLRVGAAVDITANSSPRIMEITGPTTARLFYQPGTTVGATLNLTFQNNPTKTAIYQLDTTTDTLTEFFVYPDGEYCHLYNLPTRGGVAIDGVIYQLGFWKGRVHNGVWCGDILGFNEAAANGLTNPQTIVRIKNGTLTPLNIEFDSAMDARFSTDLRSRWDWSVCVDVP